MSTRLVVRALAAAAAASAVAAALTAAVSAAPSAKAAPAAAPVVVVAPRPAPVAVVADPVLAPAPAPARIAPEPLSARRVVLYGDSLAWQSQQFFAAALERAGITNVTTRTFGGTAICDFLPQMRADAAALRPDAVVIEFSGNALTPCMKALDGSALTSAAYFERYGADAAAALDVFAPGHALVFFAGAPINHRSALSGDPTTPDLHAIYAALAESSAYGRYTDAGASVLAGGHWTETLPCLAGEPCTGGRDAHGTPVNVVRAPDGAHFCPGAPAAVLGVTAVCNVWSSGSYRFGNAMAAPVIAELASHTAA
jgi:hypothetical protein